MNNIKKVFIVMGVSGTGKSTIGKLLSEALEIPFYDGDDYHPEANIQKMQSGQALNDDDRQGWLERLNLLSKESESQGAVIACSALKQAYRDILSKDMTRKMEFVYLEGTFELIKSRLEQRKGHFMPLELLKSQFDTLEPPTDAINVSISNEPKKIVELVLGQST